MKRRRFISGSLTVAAGAIVMPALIPNSIRRKQYQWDKIKIGHIRCDRTAKEIIANRNIDAVIISSPGRLHTQHVSSPTVH